MVSNKQSLSTYRVISLMLQNCIERFSLILHIHSGYFVDTKHTESCIDNQVNLQKTDHPCIEYIYWCAQIMTLNERRICDLIKRNVYILVSCVIKYMWHFVFKYYTIASNTAVLFDLKGRPPLGCQSVIQGAAFRFDVSVHLCRTYGTKL